jgi:hypothetical protein
MRKKLAAVLCVVFLLTCGTTAYAATTVDITCQMDASYRSEYTSYVSNMTSTMANVEYPFSNKWGITFNETYMNINNLPIDSCSLAYGTACTTSSCGSSCVNSSSSDNHHKNMYRNFYKVEDDIPITGYDLMLTASASSMCYNKDGVHSTGILGLGYVGGEYTFVKNNTTRGMKLNVRVIQHELSHNFGCVDGECTTGSSCIMNGGFDNNSSYNLSNIWCSNCIADFDASLH